LNYAVKWGYIYNRLRTHHASGNKTPLQFLKTHGIIDDVKFLYLSYMS